MLVYKFRSKCGSFGKENRISAYFGIPMGRALLNRVKHQKLNQPMAELSFGWGFSVLLGPSTDIETQ